MIFVKKSLKSSTQKSGFLKIFVKMTKMIFDY